jgi:hypothetical protein
MRAGWMHLPTKRPRANKEAASLSDVTLYRAGVGSARGRWRVVGSMWS